MSDLDCEVLVVGAGPAGSAAAAALARRVGTCCWSNRTRTRGRRHAPSTPARASRRSWRGWALPRATGAPDALPLKGMRVIRGDDAVDMGYHDAAGQRHSWGLDRERFDATLAAHAVACGARLMERTALEDVHWRGGQEGSGGRVVGASLRTAEGRRTVRCRWLIGADGARSRVAQRLSMERGVGRPRRLGLIAHYEGLPELADHGEMHVARGLVCRPGAAGRQPDERRAWRCPWMGRSARPRSASRRRSTASRPWRLGCAASSG